MNSENKRIQNCGRACGDLLSRVKYGSVFEMVSSKKRGLFERLRTIKKKQGRLQLDSGTGYNLGRTNFVLAQISNEELELGFKWLVNELYEPKAFEHRLMRFIDKLEPVPGVDDSVSDLQPRVKPICPSKAPARVQPKKAFSHKEAQKALC